MTKKIFRSFMLSAVAVLLAGVVIVMTCLYSYFASVQESQLQDQLQLAAAAVETEGTDYLNKLNKLKADRYRLTWIAADGSVLCDTKRDAESLENHGDRTEVREALRTGSGHSTRYSSTLLEKTSYYARRMPDGTVLRISISRATVGMLLLGMLPAILLTAAVALILSGLLAGRLSRRITAPLNALDLEHPLENDTYEELSPLLCRINVQRRQIDSQLTDLRRRSDEFQQITSHMQEGLVLLDDAGAVLSINPAACRIFEADETCLGQDFLTVDRSRDVSAALEEAMTSGHSEVHVQRPGRIYQFDISRIRSGEDVLGAVLLAFDITQQETAEQSRREFTANVSHELKTPLQGIIGSAELIENGLVKPCPGSWATSAGRPSGWWPSSATSSVCPSWTRGTPCPGSRWISRLCAGTLPPTCGTRPRKARSALPWRDRTSRRRACAVCCMRPSITSATMPFSITSPAAASGSPSPTGETVPPFPWRIPASALRRSTRAGCLSDFTGWIRATPRPPAAQAWACLS